MTLRRHWSRPCPEIDMTAQRLTSFRWTWTLIGVVLGAALIASLVPVVDGIPPRPDVAVLVGALTFVLMGVLVAYNSPGRTITEAALAGGVLAVLVPVVLRYGFGRTLAPATTFLGIFAGVALAWVGGWVGEVMQGTIAGEVRKGFQWPWVAVGTVLGVVLNVYAVFVLYALFGLGPLGILGAFLASFFVTAFLVAYFSPGATVVEPAVAAVLVIVVDMLFTVIGFGAPFPLPVVVIAMVLAFGVALVGGYVGEVAHNARFGTAWGGVPMGEAAPKPDE